MDSAGPATIASIHVYPVKAGRAIDLTRAEVEPCGLAGDRRWLVTDPDGQFITQRAEPTLALVCARYSTRGSLHLSVAGQPPLRVPAPAEVLGAEMLWVTVWRSKVRAAAAGAAADAWFSRFLGRPARLVHLDDPTRRQVDPEFSAPEDRVSFADGYPLLLTSMASLDALNQWLAEDGQPGVPMTRFRPSVVVAGSAPWAEDGWRRIRIGTVPFRVAKPCGSVPGGQAVRALRGHHDRPADRRSGAAAAGHARPAPPVRPATGVRPEPDPRYHRHHPDRRPGAGSRRREITNLPRGGDSGAGQHGGADGAGCGPRQRCQHGAVSTGRSWRRARSSGPRRPTLAGWRSAPGGRAGRRRPGDPALPGPACP